MSTIRPRRGSALTRDRAGRVRVFALLATLGLLLSAAGERVVRGAGDPADTQYYSTAIPPKTYEGPRPILLAFGEAAPSALAEPVGLGIKPSAAPVAPVAERKLPEEPPRIASVANTPPHSLTPPESPSRPAPSASIAAPQPSTPKAPDVADSIALAKKTILECQERYQNIHDYSCTFHKRERIGGKLSAQHTMEMKSRTRPASFYFKFVTPNKGREAIYVEGRHGGKVLAHDVGFGKLLAGTMRLDPRGSMAMEDNLHPITEAGIGGLIDTIAKAWAMELSPAESVINFHPNLRVGPHACTMIESIHPRKHASFRYYAVKVYIDTEHGLPIRFESYDWPKHHGAAPELVEEYTYLNLRTNIGLHERDFDASNPQYAFGRF